VRDCRPGIPTEARDSAGNRLRQRAQATGKSEAVILLSEGVFVGVARFFGCQLCVVELETCFFPPFHLRHGVVRGGERFFAPNDVYPMINGALVLTEEVVEINAFHGSEIRWGRRARVNGEWGDSQEIDARDEFTNQQACLRPLRRRAG
jgi:hypothetical protein